MKGIPILYLIFIGCLGFAFSQDFDPGPYGVNYFETAGPFSVSDLNRQIGDSNLDGEVNIQDIVLTVNYILGYDELEDEQLIQADCNMDGLVDILDVIFEINLILGNEQLSWDFESQWNDEDSYIFITLGIPISYGLWYSNSEDDLLDNSPHNVHYFFISNNAEYMDDVMSRKADFDLITETMSVEAQAHWKKHLHFVSQKCEEIDDMFTEAVCSKRAVGIDRIQKWREIGYLGNPSNFMGTYISYLAHEALYYNYEWDAVNTAEPFTELIIVDSVVFTGYNATVPTIVELPMEEELASYSKMEVEVFIKCGGYLDDNCDDYDRIAGLRLCQGQCYDYVYFELNEAECVESGYSWDGSVGECYEINYLDDQDQGSCEASGYTWDYNRNCQEIARWITPFDRQPHWVTDITPYLAMLHPGGLKMFKPWVGGWPNAIMELKLRFFAGNETGHSPKEFIPLWFGGGYYNGDGEYVYEDNMEAVVFDIPPEAQKVEFTTYITGHGWGADNGNCAEFCNTRHFFSLNGGVFDFDKSHPEAGAMADCISLESISEGVIPNQWGTWGYGRQGWCPGLDVKPFVVDLTEHLEIGNLNVLSYETCWAPSGNNCVDYWPTITNWSGYWANIKMSSYLIISY